MCLLAFYIAGADNNSMNRLFFILLVISSVISFFARNDYRHQTDIRQELYLEPVQRTSTNNSVIQFIKDGYDYTLTPAFDYEISGLIVHTFDYSWLRFYKSDITFPVDLCMIWGEEYFHRSLSTLIAQVFPRFPVVSVPMAGTT